MPRNRWASTPGASTSCCWMPRITWWAMPWPTATPVRHGMYEVADAIMSPRGAVPPLRACSASPSTPSTSCWHFSASTPSSLRRPNSFLMIPDYLNFLLTGEKAIEYTNASTTGLLNARDRRMGRDGHGGASASLVACSATSPMPARAWGPCSPRSPAAIGYDTRVVLPATHDTGSAYLARARAAICRRCSSPRARGACSAWRTAAPSRADGGLPRKLHQRGRLPLPLSAS